MVILRRNGLWTERKCNSDKKIGRKRGKYGEEELQLPVKKVG